MCIVEKRWKVRGFFNVDVDIPVLVCHDASVKEVDVIPRESGD